jgi:hypothetical protein
VLPAEGAIARWVVSAAGRAEREFFSDFADGPAAPPQAGKTLPTARAEDIRVCQNCWHVN